MKIATWNVNSIRTRQEQVKQWLLDNQIDILCLQETKVIDADFPQQVFQQIGYHTYVYGQKSYNGVAIFSREPLSETLTGFASILPADLVVNFDEQKRVISGVIDNLRIINLYVPNGNSVGSEKYEYKLRWFKLLQEYLTTLKTEENRELLVCGDFNIAREDIDIYQAKKDDHIMSSPQERQSLNQLLSLGLQDIFRKFTPEGGYFSWWDYRHNGFAKNRGWRIDHIYLTSGLYQKATNCYIDIEPRKLIQPSDHAPVIVEF
jgi:exodeoxyribonuclease-3